MCTSNETSVTTNIIDHREAVDLDADAVSFTPPFWNQVRWCDDRLDLGERALGAEPADAAAERAERRGRRRARRSASSHVVDPLDERAARQQERRADRGDPDLGRPGAGIACRTAGSRRTTRPG